MLPDHAMLYRGVSLFIISLPSIPIPCKLPFPYPNQMYIHQSINQSINHHHLSLPYNSSTTLQTSQTLLIISPSSIPSPVPIPIPNRCIILSGCHLSLSSLRTSLKLFPCRRERRRKKFSRRCSRAVLLLLLLFLLLSGEVGWESEVEKSRGQGMKLAAVVVVDFLGGDDVDVDFCC